MFWASKKIFEKRRGNHQNFHTHCRRSVKSSRHRHTNYCATFKLSAHQMAKFKRVVCCPDSNWYKWLMECCKSFPNLLRDNLLFKQPYRSPSYKHLSWPTRYKCQSKSRHLQALSNSLRELWFIIMLIQFNAAVWWIAFQRFFDV